jgi:uncharacterized protein (TIGR02452 family)
MNRSRAAELGRETVRILEAGRYTAPSGAVVDISAEMRSAAAGTVTYAPGDWLPVGKAVAGDRPPVTTVADETTLTAAARLVGRGRRVAALNFASAKNPGGGFLNGARAQEESLARCSGLYPCLVGSPMYEFHRARHDPLYSDSAVYSPDVPVIRGDDDDGELLERPYPVSFITCPAPNAKVALERDPRCGPAIEKAVRRRAARVLSVAAAHGHDTLVLGAWGCGVFGNDPALVAETFADLLIRSSSPFRGVFAEVAFAVWDLSSDGHIIAPFEREFGGRGTADGD